jgi:tRNA (guanine10-N2)-dimethyltransferase
LALSESAEKDVGARSGPQTEDMPPPTLLDPFCGTGVILQEAALMGYRVYGTDLNETMVRYSHDNLKWLEETRSIRIDTHYETVDAADHVWRQPIDIVACEGYLGHPFSEEPDSKALKATMQTCDVVMKKFLRNIHAQLTPGTRLCVAVPAWHVAGRVHHLPMLPTIESMGYRRVAFSAAPSSDLLYYREGQVVARELLVLIKP